MSGTPTAATTSCCLGFAPLRRRALPAEAQKADVQVAVIYPAPDSTPCSRVSSKKEEAEEIDFDSLPCVARSSTEKTERIVKRKNRFDRALIAARSEIDSVLELDGMPAAAVTRLKAVEKRLREVEVEIARLRAPGAPTALPGHWQRLLDKKEPVHEETRRHLLSTYVDKQHRSAQHAMLTPTRTYRSSARLSIVSNASDSPDSSLFSRAMSYSPGGSGGKEPSRRDATTHGEVATILDALGTLHFDALALQRRPEVGGKPIFAIGKRLLQEDGLADDLHSAAFVADAGSFRERALRFYSAVDHLYKRDAIYHGNAHGADVMATVAWFMRFPFLQEQCHSLDYFLITMAGAIHDLGHPGTNNLFQCTTMSDLAVRYNDKSVLENFHVASSFEFLLSREEHNWYSLIQDAFRQPEGGSKTPALNLQQYSRKMLIDMVLGTDMAKHATHVSKIQELASKERAAGQHEEVAGDSLERKVMIMETVLHAADISNPCKPRPMMLAWAEKVLCEFWAQGDEERKRGLPVSPLCDRDSGRKAVAKGQLGFIKFVILPFWTPIAELMFDAKEATKMLADNMTFWEEQDKKQATYEQIFGA
eukprot:TRINITY_DN71493_c0_g1_i1.p1 TRINITY_DN71493_c0_g1~~TRINITY_DN71493_c0_g1_i1.p1  ORF type:complete len:592 (-),score=133.94 TRINITY_DN71493_c0_g1_i1:321-2096(-)